MVGMAVVGWWWWAGGGGGVQVGHKSEAAFQGQLLTAGDAIAKLPRLNTKKALIAAYMESPNEQLQLSIISYFKFQHCRITSI